MTARPHNGADSNTPEDSNMTTNTRTPAAGWMAEVHAAIQTDAAYATAALARSTTPDITPLEGGVDVWYPDMLTNAEAETWLTTLKSAAIRWQITNIGRMDHDAAEEGASAVAAWLLSRPAEWYEARGITDATDAMRIGIGAGKRAQWRPLDSGSDSYRGSKAGAQSTARPCHMAGCTVSIPDHLDGWPVWVEPGMVLLCHYRSWLALVDSADGVLVDEDRHPVPHTITAISPDRRTLTVAPHGAVDTGAVPARGVVRIGGYTRRPPNEASPEIAPPAAAAIVAAGHGETLGYRITETPTEEEFFYVHHRTVYNRNDRGEEGTGTPDSAMISTTDWGMTTAPQPAPQPPPQPAPPTAPANATPAEAIAWEMTRKRKARQSRASARWRALRRARAASARNA